MESISISRLFYESEFLVRRGKNFRMKIAPFFDDEMNMETCMLFKSRLEKISAAPSFTLECKTDHIPKKRYFFPRGVYLEGKEEEFME